MSQLDPTPDASAAQALTPLDVWQAYPIADLLEVSPPQAGETFDDYLKRTGSAPEMLDDMLFFFLLREFHDCADDLVECRHRLVCAICDLELLQKRLVKFHVEDEWLDHGRRGPW